MNFKNKLVPTKVRFSNLLPLIFCLTVGINRSIAQTIYKTENLELIQLTEHCIIHISYLQTDDYGKVACNGLLYISNNKILIVDTPADSLGTLELIQWVKTATTYHIQAIVPTHFHRDCLAGLDQLHATGATSYANNKTIEMSKQNDLSRPKNGFEKEQELLVGDQKVILFYPGEGHTLDNIVCFIPEDKVLFGGCLVKALGAGKGFTDDGNETTWSQTIENVKYRFADVKYVVPGHGESGDSNLLDFTIQMFK